MSGPWRGRAADALVFAALGALQTLAFVHTAMWPLQLLCIAALAWRVARAAPARAALVGWAFGSAWIGAGVWWLFISMHRYGGLPAPLAAAAVALLAMALALYLALAMALQARWRRDRPLIDATTFAAWWLLAELARGVLFTGFPWVASGYVHVDAPLARLAPWIGVYGIGAVAAGLAALLIARWRLALPLIAVVLLALTLLPAPSFTQAQGRLSIALVQTGVAQDEKFDVERLPKVLASVAVALTEARADLVVVPETAVPLLPGQLDDLVPGYWDRLRRHFALYGRAALVGVPLGDYERGYTNSVIGLSDRADYRYDKHHLVPFGEFIPRGFRWFTEMMNIPLGDFNRGVPNPPSFAVRQERVAPNICYEDLFGEELARRFADPASAPTLFANLSNIAWFGDTVAIEQHLNISRLRSLEFQRPMLRATNTGATALIDHRGRVVARLPSQLPGVLHGQAEGRRGLTPFAWWSARAGLWPLWLGALAVLLLAARLRRAGAPAAPAARR